MKISLPKEKITMIWTWDKKITHTNLKMKAIMMKFILNKKKK